MKNTLLIAALALAATPAMASKARLTALSNAANLSDIQDVFGNSAKATDSSDWLTFEFGTTPTTNGTASATSTKAEGGFSRSMGDSKYGFYLGHHSAWITEVRQTAFLPPDNAVNLFYAHKAGDLAWGLGLEYSNTDKKTTKEKQSALGLNAGVKMANWDAGLTLGLTNTYKNETTGPTYVDFKGGTAIDLHGQYNMDNMSYFGGYAINGGKQDAGGGPSQTRDIERSVLNLGAENSMKRDGANFFYGVKYVMTNVKNKAAIANMTVGDSVKSERSELPLYMGIEADATSWMVLRGSVQQNILIGSNKASVVVAGPAEGSSDADTISNNTAVAAGAGLKFGKLTVDGTLSAATSATGALNASAMLANGSLTYMF